MDAKLNPSGTQVAQRRPVKWKRRRAQDRGGEVAVQFEEIRKPGVAELADAADSKSAGALLRVGSTPSSGTKLSCGTAAKERLVVGDKAGKASC